jgi:hypothetical protein
MAAQIGKNAVFPIPDKRLVWHADCSHISRNVKNGETQAMTLQEAHNFLFEPLPYCGCGDPQAILEKIQACLEYAENW